MPGKSVAQKLYIRPNYTVLLLNAPRGYEAALGDLPDGAKVVSQAKKPADLIQLFATKKTEMSALFRKAKPLLKEDGILWATYPKAGQMETDLKREVVWECGQTVGMHPVAQIAVDEIWSALRFRQA